MRNNISENVVIRFRIRKLFMPGMMPFMFVKKDIGFFGFA